MTRFKKVRSIFCKTNPQLLLKIKKKLPNLSFIIPQFGKPRHLYMFSIKYWSLMLCMLLVIVLAVWTQPNLKPKSTLKIYDRNGQLLFELAGEVGRKQEASFDQFPTHLVQAVLSAEDERYYDHPGVDVKAIIRSMYSNLKERRIVSGASTITQQVARLHSGAVSGNILLRFVAKIRQSITALRLTAAFSKEDILTSYLNEVYLGNHNYGFAAAANFYFHKNVDKLSLNESAYLAGMIASPAKYNPYMHQSDGENRKIYVLEKMGANGLITRETIDVLKNQPNYFAKPEADMIAPHFIEYVQSQLKTLHLPTRDVSIYTTLDINTFKLSQKIASYWVEKLKDLNNVHNASMVVLDNRTGEILSMLGGINYFDAANDGSVNMVTALRQPGSTIKLVTYTAAFMQGFTPATLLLDVKTSYQTKKGEGFIPNNFGDTYHGLVLARTALASSFNQSAVEMLDKIGIDSFIQTAKALGLSSYQDPAQYDYALTLGANEVSLLELANAYATIARGGVFRQTYVISKVTNSRKRVIFEHIPSVGEQRLGSYGEQVAFLISDILADPIARMPGFGEKNYLTMSRPAAVKTGTTTDWHDVWTVGYTPSYTVGVWMGNNDNTAMNRISSATGAAPVWNQFLEEFLKDKPVEEFAKPKGIVELEICALSGDLYDNLCPERKMEYFIAGTQPKHPSSMHKLVAIDTRNSLLASPQCPAEVVEQKLLIDYPPAVYSWARDNNKPALPHDYSPLCLGMNDNSPALPLYISITNPKNKAVFENAPQLISRQGISLEASVSPSIKKVIWYVDAMVVAQTFQPPFSAILPLKSGEHMVYAVASDEKTSQTSDPIFFTVIN